MRPIVLLLLVALLFSCSPPKSAEAPTVALTAPVMALQYRGTNLSGAEFGSRVPGKFDVDYTYPTSKDVDYFLATGMNFLRVPFLHERLQSALQGQLNETEWARLNTLVTYATSKGMTVAIEPHNSARFNGRIVTEVQFGDFWGRVSQRFKDNPRVWLNLTNEPHDMSTEVWLALANAGLREVRRVGFTGHVLVPGNAWTGAGHWTSNWYGTPNSVAMLKVVDSGNNMSFEVHQYLDPDAGGGGSECVSVDIGVQRMTGFVNWLRKNKRLGFLGEFGAPDTAMCREAIKKMLTYVEAQFDVLEGWSWWSAGPWWAGSDGSRYILSLSPHPYPNGPESPQLSWLRPFLRPAAPPPPPNPCPQ